MIIMKLSSKLRSWTTKDKTMSGLIYWCQGCKTHHKVVTSTIGSSAWKWNNNVDLPTFSPSVLVTGTILTNKGERDYEKWLANGARQPAPKFESKDTRCHTFIKEGQVQFLNDCTHSLAGQTLPLPDLPSDEVVIGGE